MDSEGTLYKTAELVRDAVGCYYFICLQCGKDFENLEDTVLHIEKYFYEPTDDNNADASVTPVTINETDWMTNDGDVESAVLANIKKESFEEYEDYKLSIPHENQLDDDGMTTKQRLPIHCPLCSKTLNRWESSLESHLMRVHHRTRSFAKIYECKFCGKNTFTRPYDLERHELNHRPVDDESTMASDNYGSRRNGDRNQNSMLRNILRQSENTSIPETVMDEPIHYPTDVSPDAAPLVKIRTPNKRYLSISETNVERPPKKPKSMQPIVIDKLASRSLASSRPPNYCSICRGTFSKKDTLESHLIRVHRRNKQYAKVYECNVCGKNTFTRPYDLRRHQLTHMAKDRKVRKVPLPKKAFKTEPKIENKATINQVPLIKRTSPVKPETTSSMESTSSATEVKKIPTNNRTTDPQKDGILCAICSKKFESYLDVTLHLKFVHNQKRTYKCSHPSCPADSFNNAFMLHRHELSHSDHYGNVVGNVQNRTKCVFCRRSFNKKWNLMQHEKRHLAEMSEMK